MSVCGCTKKSDLKVAMLTDFGKIQDRSFNQIIWEGLQRASMEFEIEANYLESHSESDYLPNLEKLSEEGNNLILGNGFKMDKPLLEAATKNPKQKYAGVDCYFENPAANLVGVTFKDQESAYLVGYIAGKMTKTNQVGFIGGMDTPVIHKFLYGYLAGVKKANPNAEVNRQYLGSFTDIDQAREMAKQMYENNVDIIFQAAGGAGDGIIEAAVIAGKYVIGVDKDQSCLAPENVLTSAMKRMDNAAYNLVKALIAGKFPGGTNVVYGLQENGVGIAASSSNLVPAEILNEVKELKDQIISGAIVPPTNSEEWGKLHS